MFDRLKIDKLKFVIFGLLLFSGCLGGFAQDTEYAQLAYSDFSVPSFKELIDEANQLAIDWDNNAYLWEIQFSVYPKNYDGQSSVSFSFESIMSKSLLVITFLRNNSDRSVESRIYPYTDLELYSPKPRIEIQNLSSDSHEAFAYIYQNWGDSFFAENRQITLPIYFVLEPNRFSDQEEHNPEWRVLFIAEPTQGGSYMSVIIDARTFELLEIQKH